MSDAKKPTTVDEIVERWGFAAAQTTSFHADCIRGALNDFAELVAGKLEAREIQEVKLFNDAKPDSHEKSYRDGTTDALFGAQGLVLSLVAPSAKETPCHECEALVNPPERCTGDHDGGPAKETPTSSGWACPRHGNEFVRCCPAARETP